MNLSPKWCSTFAKHNFESVHWSNIGAVNSPDKEILQWARDNNYCIFTNDLDFGAILANASLDAPSVIQVRHQALLPEDIEDIVIHALKTCETILSDGALLVIEPTKSRVRMLPLREYNA